ncbi:MAG: homoserine kinase [Lysobacterales bacterium]
MTNQDNSRDSVSLGNIREACAFAPASVGNVAVGFDVLGHALQGVGDTVTVRQTEQPGIHLSGVTGVLESLPTNVEENTALKAVHAMVDSLSLDSGFEVDVDKGIPLGSGLGGSAASAAAAVVAVNKMLKIPLPINQLYPYALAGERAASGSEHGDNVAASLLGGLAIVGPYGQRYPMSIPAPSRLRCIVVHPQIQIETRDARATLKKGFSRELVVAQSANLAAFIAGCFEKNMDVISCSLKDLLVEPQRAESIPGFKAVKSAALEAGAVGCSISGSGPSVFAWFQAESAATVGGESMAAAFAEAGLATTVYSSPVNCPGARLVTDAAGGS